MLLLRSFIMSKMSSGKWWVCENVQTIHLEVILLCYGLAVNETFWLYSTSHSWWIISRGIRIRLRDEILRAFYGAVGHSYLNRAISWSMSSWSSALKKDIFPLNKKRACGTRFHSSVPVRGFSTVYRSRGVSGQRSGRQSQTDGWRGHLPVSGSSPPLRWCGSSRRRRLRCSTVPTLRPPPAAWRSRHGGSGSLCQQLKQQFQNIFTDIFTYSCHSNVH